MRACRDHWQRRRTRRRHESRPSPEEAVVAGPSIELIAFWDAVHRLPGRPRLVVTLFYAGDRSIAEVASTMHGPEGTVKSDLARARVVLKTELGC